MRVIGLGAKDDADLAVDFVVSREVDGFPMYWDDSFESWIAFGVTAQPAAILLDGDGNELGSWRGMFPVDEVLDLAGG